MFRQGRIITANSSHHQYHCKKTSGPALNYTLSLKFLILCFFFSIVKVRETRLTGLLSSILIALSLLMLPTPLKLVPTPVLDGLFLFMAITALDGNQMFERALLLITEQVKKYTT